MSDFVRVEDVFELFWETKFKDMWFGKEIYEQNTLKGWFPTNLG